MDQTQKEVSDNGKMWAMISYAGFFFGFPIGFIPLVQRDDEYAIHHARNATAVWLAFFVTFIVAFAVLFPLAFCTFGLANFVIIPLLLLLTLWPLAVSIHGLILTTNGSWDEPIGVFGLGQRLFGGITVKPTAELPAPVDELDTGPPADEAEVVDRAKVDALAEMEQAFPDQGEKKA